jgi:hypothetical protein
MVIGPQELHQKDLQQDRSVILVFSSYNAVFVALMLEMMMASWLPADSCGNLGRNVPVPGV